MTNATTQFGRQKEAWEVYPSEFCDRGGILRNSPMGTRIYALSESEFSQLVELCDPAEDNLMHVDKHGCTINHGNVGSRGISYDWV